MNNLFYSKPEICVEAFDIDDVITVSTVVTTAPATTLPGTTASSTGGIGIGEGGSDGYIDFNDIE